MKTLTGTEELQKNIDDYFLSLEPAYRYTDDGEIITDKSGVPVLTERQPATVSSLAYAIGCASRKEFDKIKNTRKYKTILERALLRLEAYTERMLFDKSASAGAKFLLESDFGRNESADDRKSEAGVVILADVERAGEDN